MIIAVKTEFFGLDSNGRRVTIAHFIGDSAADLPEISTYQSGGIQITTGSTFHSVADGADYEMQSSGAWILSRAGTAAYTKAEIDAMMQAKQDLLVIGTNFDSEPTSGSDNPVRSGGVVNYTFGAAAVIIPTGANLNSYIDPGAYRCETNAIAASLINCPTSNGFRMEVKSTIASAATGYQLQFIYPNNANGEFFMRRRGSASSGTWSSWFKFSGTAV